MTKDSIIKTGIAAYEQMLAFSKTHSTSEIKLYAETEKLDRGFCYYASVVLNEDIYKEDWVNKNCNGLYWAKNITQCYTKRDIIKSIKTRLKILKSELNEKILV